MTSTRAITATTLMAMFTCYVMIFSGCSTTAGLPAPAAASSDAEAVTLDRAALTFVAIRGVNGSPDALRADLNLYTIGTYGSIISWISSDPTAIASDGTVTRPPVGAGDATATLTANLTRGVAADTKAFIFTVRETIPVTDQQALADAAILRINADRALPVNGSLPPLIVSAPITTAANRHTLDMACNCIYGHDGTDGSTPTSRAADAGYAPGTVNELIAFGCDSADDAVDAWMADPGLRALLLNGTHVHIGGSVKSIHFIRYWTIVVANP